MGVTRKWIFPIVRILLLAALTVALVKIAFFADGANESSPVQPTGVMNQPEVAVVVANIVNEVSLKGSVTADAAVPVKSIGVGTVDEVFASQGQWVDAGTTLYDIKVETVRDPGESIGPDGMPAVTQPKPTVSFEKVLAPISGTLTALSVLEGQSVAIGDTTGQIAPPSFSVTGSLSPEQQYRLVSKPSEALIEITGGPAAFQCTGLTITTPLQGAATDANGGAAGASSGGTATTVSCAVPADITVFPGLAATITIAAGNVENALTVPTTAVKGSAESGTVWAKSADGSNEERPVVLGLNNGKIVQIVSGLGEGDMILEFVPGALPQSEDGCMQQPDGSLMCTEVQAK